MHLATEVYEMSLFPIKLILNSEMGPGPGFLSTIDTASWAPVPAGLSCAQEDGTAGLLSTPEALEPASRCACSPGPVHRPPNLCALRVSGLSIELAEEMN